METPKFNIPSIPSPITPLNFMNNMEWRDGSMVSTKEITAKEFIKKLSFKDGKQIIGDRENQSK